MSRIHYGLIYLLVFCVPFTGYASFKPVDLNPRIKSGQLVQKTGNFIVLFDKSASMGEVHGKPMVNEATRLTHAKDAVRNMKRRFRKSSFTQGSGLSGTKKRIFFME